MTEYSHPDSVHEHEVPFEDVVTRHLDSRVELIESLKRLGLTDLVRLFRKDQDPVAALARSSGVFSELAAVHFHGDKPGLALKTMIELGLQHTKDEELEEAVPQAHAWILREYSSVLGLTPEGKISE